MGGVWALLEIDKAVPGYIAAIWRLCPLRAKIQIATTVLLVACSAAFSSLGPVFLKSVIEAVEKEGVRGDASFIHSAALYLLLLLVYRSLNDIRGAMLSIMSAGNMRKSWTRPGHCSATFSYLRAGSSLVQGIAFSAMVGGVLIYAAAGVRSGQFAVSHFVMLVTYVVQVCRPLDSLSMAIGDVQRSAAFLEPFFKFNTHRSGAPAGPGCTPEETGISFKDVEFSYRPDVPVLNSVSFFIPKGAVSAIVGPTGGRKDNDRPSHPCRLPLHCILNRYARGKNGFPN